MRLKWIIETANGVQVAPIAIACAAVALGLMVAPICRERLLLTANQHDIGHADRAAYAQQARSIVEGRGGRIPYITNFYRRYDTSIWRYDDHWPVFPAWLLVPAFRFRGVDAVHARATMIVVGAVALPLAAAWLAGVSTGTVWAALGAGILMLTSVTILRESFEVLGDVPLAALMAACGAALLQSRRHRAWLVLAGLLGGCAALTKGSHVLLLALIPVLACLLHGGRILFNRWLLGGLLLFLLLMTPSWLRMVRQFGDPFHSTQNYVSAFYGLELGSRGNWDRNFYAVHWNRNLPSLRARFDDRTLYRRSLRRNAEPYLRVLLLGPDAGRNDWSHIGAVGVALREWLLRDIPIRLGQRTEALVTSPRAWPMPYSTATGTAAIAAGIAALSLLGPIALVAAGLRLWRRRRGMPSAVSVPVWLTNAVVLAILIVFQAGFVIATWLTQTRFTLTILPPAYALGLMVPAKLVTCVTWPLARLARRHPVVGVAGSHLRWLGAIGLCIFTTAVWRSHAEALSERQRDEARIPIRKQPHYPRSYRLARWIEKQASEDAIVMTRYPWQFTFYSAPTIRAVGLPYAEPPVIFAVARYYNVTHFIFDHERPGLRAFMESGHPAIRLLQNGPHPIYAIDYEAFAPDELAALPPVSEDAR